MNKNIRFQPLKPSLKKSKGLKSLQNFNKSMKMWYQNLLIHMITNLSKNMNKNIRLQPLKPSLEKSKGRKSLPNLVKMLYQNIKLYLLIHMNTKVELDILVQHLYEVWQTFSSF